MILLNVTTEDTFLVIDENGEEIDLSDTFLFEVECFRHSSYNYFEDIIARTEEEPEDPWFHPPYDDMAESQSEWDT